MAADPIILPTPQDGVDQPLLALVAILPRNLQSGSDAIDDKRRISRHSCGSSNHSISSYCVSPCSRQHGERPGVPTRIMSSSLQTEEPSSAIEEEKVLRQYLVRVESPPDICISSRDVANHKTPPWSQDHRRGVHWRVLSCARLSSLNLVGNPRQPKYGFPIDRNNLARRSLMQSK